MIRVGAARLDQDVKVALVVKHLLHLDPVFPLVMLDQLVARLVEKLKGGQDLPEVFLGLAKDFEDGLVRREREDGHVGRLGSTRTEDRDGRDDPDGPFRADEQLLQVETLRSAG